MFKVALVGSRRRRLNDNNNNNDDEKYSSDRYHFVYYCKIKSIIFLLVCLFERMQTKCGFNR